ncbi:MAG: lamin tail domain-containing protein [Pyrinomonadaceae bacterium]
MNIKNIIERSSSFAKAAFAVLVLGTLSFGQTTFGKILVQGDGSLAPQVSPNVVISQIYGGSGANNAYQADYVELYNLSNAAVDISGYSIQYITQGSLTVSATGTLPGAAGSNTTVIAARSYFLIQLNPANTSGTASPLPAPDYDASASFASTGISGTQGKIILASDSTAVTGCPASQTMNVVDKVGFGTTSMACNETANAPAPSSSRAILRKGIDTDNNSADFITGTPSPRNSSFTSDLTISQSAPASANTGTNYDYTLTITNSTASTVNGIVATFKVPANTTYVSSSVAGTFTATQSGGIVTFSGGTLAGATSAQVTVTVTAPATTQTITSNGTDVTVDPNNTIGETNDANNNAADSMTIINAPTAASASIGGRVTQPNGRGIFRARITMIDSQGNTSMAYTNQMGFYRFEDVPSGATYILSVSHRRYQFANPSSVQFVNEDNSEINFVSSGENRGLYPVPSRLDKQPQ